MSSDNSRLSRLLALVPYLQAHQGIAVAEAAAEFGITAEQLRRDLQLLWMCGLPGHGPGDLIDLSFEGETVSVLFDAGISRPQRLTSDEAFALIIALRALAETPEVDHDAVSSALAKIEAVSETALAEAGTETVAVAADPSAKTRRLLAEAIGSSRALQLRYYTAARDQISERVVDPLRIFDVDGRTYLEGWCRSAEGVRIFRLDRIDSAEILDEPSAPPPEAELRNLEAGFFAPSPEHLVVELEVAESYDWVTDYYADVQVGEMQADNMRRVSLRVADTAWVTRLVLGAQGEVRVHSPTWLAHEIAAEARRALAGYDMA